jgi:hypothetical protein
MNEAIVGIARAAHFEQIAATPLRRARRVGLAPVRYLETNREVARAAIREALLLDEVRPSERHRRRPVVAPPETHSQYRAGGGRSSLRTARTG